MAVFRVVCCHFYLSAAVIALNAFWRCVQFVIMLNIIDKLRVGAYGLYLTIKLFIIYFPSRCIINKFLLLQ